MSQQSVLIAISEDMLIDTSIDHDAYLREQALKGLKLEGIASLADVRYERIDSENYTRLRQLLYRCSVTRGRDVQTGAPEVRSA